MVAGIVKPQSVTNMESDMKKTHLSFVFLLGALTFGGGLWVGLSMAPWTVQAQDTADLSRYEIHTAATSDNWYALKFDRQTGEASILRKGKDDDKWLILPEKRKN